MGGVTGPIFQDTALVGPPRPPAQRTDCSDVSTEAPGTL